MTTKVFSGKRYELYDGFPGKREAMRCVKSLRVSGDLARMVDSGKKAGRLRYLVYHRMKR